MKRIKEVKGITLIALVITIIVMLILVGVTLNVVLNNGLMENAKEAKNKQEIERDREILYSAVLGHIKNGEIDIEEFMNEYGNNGLNGYSFESNNSHITATKGDIVFYIRKNGKVVYNNEEYSFNLGEFLALKSEMQDSHICVDINDFENLIGITIDELEEDYILDVSNGYDLIDFFTSDIELIEGTNKYLESGLGIEVNSNYIGLIAYTNNSRGEFIEFLACRKSNDIFIPVITDGIDEEANQNEYENFMEEVKDLTITLVKKDKLEETFERVRNLYNYNN